MKRFILTLTILAMFVKCEQSEFADNYADPNKIDRTTVGKQYAGTLVANKDYVLPAYWNYFVVLRTSIKPWTQSVGWVNGLRQYIPGSAGTNAFWGQYYGLLEQYRELQKVHDALPEEEQQKNRIFMMTATIYLYDQTQKLVDIFGSVPFNEAGRLSQNGGDYINSLPAYDAAEEIYTKMLDDLKSFADELNTINIDPTAIKPDFENKDFINKGDLDRWKKYCNSLRLRILNRVSAVPAFASRSSTEMKAILDDPATYPVVDKNSENVQMTVEDLETPISSKDGRWLKDGNGNLAGKKMIDFMLANTDPRLRVMFERGGDPKSDTYQGVNPLDNQKDQEVFINNEDPTIYNRSTFNENEYFPGILINAAEVSLIKAEYYLRNGNAAMAKMSYEDGIRQSVEWYYWVRSLSANTVSGKLTPLGDSEIATYLSAADVNWDEATAAEDKLKLIATQKWIHYSVVQCHESWAEQRRLDLPALEFLPDNEDAQKLPPVRWLYPDSERDFNAENLATVKDQDNLTSRIFWDVK